MTEAAPTSAAPTTAAPSTSAAPTPVVPTTAAPGTLAPADWMSGITDEPTRSWVTAKGFKDVGNLATSALNLEKLTGDLNSIVKLPKADAAASEWAPIYDKLGRPAAPADYKLPVPEGVDPAFSNTAAGWFHEHGLSAKQGQGLAAKWSEYMTAATTAQQAATAAAHQTQLDGLKVEWGAAMQSNSAIVDQAASAFGMTTDHLNALKAAMGPAGAMKFLHAIGSKLGTEPGFVGADTRGGGFAMAPDAAKAELSVLKNDKDFITRYAKGDREAVATMSRLHKFAYPVG